MVFLKWQFKSTRGMPHSHITMIALFIVKQTPVWLILDFNTVFDKINTIRLIFTLYFIYGTKMTKGNQTQLKL